MPRSPHRKPPPGCRDRRLADPAKIKAAPASPGCSPPTEPEPKWRAPIPIPRSKSHDHCAPELRTIAAWEAYKAGRAIWRSQFATDVLVGLNPDLAPRIRALNEGEDARSRGGL